MTNRGQRAFRPLLAVEPNDYLDVADVLLVTLNADGRVSHINRKGCEILGYDEKDIVQKEWFEHFVPASARDRVREMFRQIMSGNVRLVERTDNPVLTRSGQERLLAWHNAPIRIADGRITGTVSSGLDITQRRAIEEQQRRSVQELSDVKFALDQSAIVATTDAKGRITHVNDKFCEIAGYAREELLGQDHRLINSRHHPKTFFHDLWTTIAAGELWRGEIRNQAKDGTYYWVDTTIVPFVDSNGAPFQYMAIRYDITEQKSTQIKLHEQETLARLGKLSAVVAHEVKNPLAGISGALQVVASRLPIDGRDRTIIDDVQNRISSLDGMLQDLLLFARPRGPAPTATALSPLLRDVASSVSQDLAFHGIDIQVTGDKPTLRIDREQIRIVFQNLLINAAQAMGGRGPVAVNVTSRGPTCVVTVADQGPGVAPEVAHQIFEPFVTTKHRGSGLGLPTARRLVEAHGGTLSAENRSPCGAVLTVNLPEPHP